MQLRADAKAMLDSLAKLEGIHSEIYERLQRVDEHAFNIAAEHVSDTSSTVNELMRHQLRVQMSFLSAFLAAATGQLTQLEPQLSTAVEALIAPAVEARANQRKEFRA
ncbi:unnamed protein product [Vitrella brassicaformis CCMP3155]|uniref:Uncharacterized protein n=1 Tax=Vitrella brassicaformis (strain CCMP3155) TaxID=1169540 RepID=A0A0G4FA71_VITBC|nr:unnamed protein product [Vitrella brassicaformis CCMP3155]|eukprot:CEM09872.1 unnamed protein product [Vitrella brassicaformis CCMP3155]